MAKKIILGFCLSVISLSGFSQTDTIRGEQAAQMIKEITKKVIDTTKFLSQTGRSTCLCIDTIKLLGKGRNEISKEIAACIDKEVTGYQLALLIYRSMVSGSKDNKLSLTTDKNSNEYRRYYFEIESWLRDSCKSLNNAVAAENKESDFSFSKNENSMAAYNRGISELNKQNFQEAAEYFATAVGLDSKFAFAWDNLGICYRRLGKYDEAIAAYNKSLEVDPKGVTPLHNIPVAYEFQKKYDKALEAYQNILKYYPGDPEAYYGEGRIYTYFKIDMEKALQNMCKAYNIYISLSSPYRVDAEKNINYIYSKMKEDGKEARFFEILKENNISTGK